MNVSRRKFAQLVGAGAAALLTRPAVTLAKSSVGNRLAAPGLVRLSANENPYGPSAHALRAMNDSFPLSCRYPDEHTRALVDSLAKLHAVNSDQVLIGDGSSEILKLCAEAFTGRDDKTDGAGAGSKLVAADPTFEAILNYAGSNGAEIVKVPLTPGYAHDLQKMDAVTGAGLIYVCNPNNPTASITPKNELREFINDLPPQTILLVDEAYFHYADSTDYESVIPLIRDHPNLIVARTFSKIYGMAGLRCGYCVAQPALISRLRQYQPWDSVNCMALAAAVASLNDKSQVDDGKSLINEVKRSVIDQLDSAGYETIPSQANFIMVDVRQPVTPLIESMKERGVQVGRLFPALPHHMRVTIGKKREMDAFLTAFQQVA